MSYGRDDKLTRAGLAWLLDQHPDRPVPAIDTQEPGPLNAIPGPWVCVDFSPGERFAIWKTTGAVHRLDAEGAVEDPALHRPTEETIALAAERTVTLTDDDWADLEGGQGCIVRDGVRVLYD